MKRLLILATLLFSVLPSFAQYALQFGSAVAADNDAIYVGEGRNILQAGTLFQFEQDADGEWAMARAIKPSDTENRGDGFGRAVSISNNTMVVGAPLVGAIYVFERTSDGAWAETARLSADAIGLGSNVATDGKHILATAAGDRNESASIHAWVRSDAGWLDASGFAPTEEGNTGLGAALAVTGDRAAIGSPSADGRKGRVETFSFKDGSWHADGPIEHSREMEGDAFGSALLMEDSHMIVGMPGHDGRKGAAAVYFQNSDTGQWTYQYKLEPFDSAGNEQFGASLAFNGTSVWIGAPGYGDSNGTIYSYEINAETMRMKSTEMVQPLMLQYRSGFGGAVAVSGTHAVVGSPGHDNFEGAGFVFQQDESGWIESGVVLSDSGVFETITGDKVSCEEEVAAGFPCENVDIISFLSRGDVGAERGIQMNDVWGWTDPETGTEWAIVGRTDGTSFVSLADPSHPLFVGDLPHTASGHRSLWRDMKVYKDHAYIVADGAGAHHMQIYDLTQLRDITQFPTTLMETNIYKGVFSSHNLHINLDTGFGYAVGNDSGGETCGGALHMMDLNDPANPVFVGCFNDPTTHGGSGATHDVQCVSYHGPDADYAGREVCLSSNGNALSIADVTNKSNPTAISTADYPNVAYTHQGWLTEDHRYFFLNDEGDESSGIVDATRTLIFDLQDLDEPILASEYLADNSAIDHDLYIKGNLMYQTNYVAGLRIIDVSDPENPVEVASFDTVPYGPNDNSPVLGAWSSYPFFKSGLIVVTSGREGVFFLKKKEIDT